MYYLALKNFKQEENQFHFTYLLTLLLTYLGNLKLYDFSSNLSCIKNKTKENGNCTYSWQ